MGCSAIIKWAINNNAILKDNSNLISYKTGDKIAIRFKYNKPDKNYKINFENKLTKKIEEEVFSNYPYSLQVTRTVRMPYAYAVPIKKEKIINLLHRHGFISKRSTQSDLFIIQKYLVLSRISHKIKGKPRPPKKVRLMSMEEENDLSDFEIFLTSQEGGHSLPFLLEPQSEYGLPRYQELNLAINPGNTYPILRVIKKKDTTKEEDKAETKEEDKAETKEEDKAETKEEDIIKRSYGVPIRIFGDKKS